MKKKYLVLVISVIVFLLIVPFRSVLKDGGSVRYDAVLYDVTDWHALTPVEGEYMEGVTVRILGMTIYDSAEWEKSGNR